MNKVKKLDDSSFERAVALSDKLTIIAGINENCNVCEQLKSMLEKFATDIQPVDYYIITVPENNNFFEKFSVYSVPAILFFKNGQKLSEVVGLYPEDTLKMKIKSLI
jgi:thioredoxin 1